MLDMKCPYCGNWVNSNDDVMSCVMVVCGASWSWDGIALTEPVVDNADDDQ